MIIEREVILAKDAKLLRTDDRPLLRRQFPGQQLHERGLASAVGSGETVPPSGGKSSGDVLEEHPRAVTHGHTVD
jgi:hypothetical protein